MTAEGAIGLAAGITAGSIALTGWALGSVVEGLASIIVVWRFTGARTISESAERRAQRGVAISFWLLAPYIAIQAVRDLAGGHHVAVTVLGIAVTASSVVIMPALGITKQRLGRRLSSGATAGEGIQNLMCAAQAAANKHSTPPAAKVGTGLLAPARRSRRPLRTPPPNPAAGPDGGRVMSRVGVADHAVTPEAPGRVPAGVNPLAAGSREVARIEALLGLARPQLS